MGGFITPIKGATSPPATTIYFGFVPDRLSVLCSAAPSSSGNVGYAFTGSSPSGGMAPLVSNWVPYNPSQIGGSSGVTSSFGSSVSAPDGSNNGVHVIEGTNNGIHAVCSVFPTDAFTGGFKLRTSIFAQAAERTRFALYMSGGSADPNNNFPGGGYYGCKTVFDLAAGQIGVANIAFGSPNIAWSPGPTEIVPFGAGWYRCTMDVLTGSSISQGTTPSFAFQILIDAGSGTGSEDTNYIGNGTSGVNFWRCTSLPPGAWALNNVSFIDDFTTLATIDTGKTNAPGFGWYLNTNWPGFVPSPTPTPTYTDPTKLSIVSGTILKVAANYGESNLALQSAAPNPSYPGDGSFILGNLFRGPALLEWSASWDGLAAGVPGPPPDDGPTFWTRNIESSAAANLNAVTEDSEFDMPEYTPGGEGDPHPGSSFSVGPSSGNGIWGSTVATNGIPIWYAAFAYQNANYRVWFNNVQYISLGGTTNNEPDVSPSQWATYSSITGEDPNPPQIDWTQQHVYQTLWTTYSANDVGQILTFFDNRYCFFANHISNGQGHIIYSPLINNATLGNSGPNPYIVDRLNYPYFFGGSPNFNFFVDYVKNTQ